MRPCFSVPFGLRQVTAFDLEALESAAGRRFPDVEREEFLDVQTRSKDEVARLPTCRSDMNLVYLLVRRREHTWLRIEYSRFLK
jgi:hypothetical protein